MKESGSSPISLYQRIYALVCQVPAGYVTTYGRIGELVGCSGRTVGFAMAGLPAGSDVPWQRVINSQGRVSRRQDGEGSVLQRDLLEVEGVCFDQQGRVSLDRFGYPFGGD